MHIVNREELFAKTDVRAALDELRNALRRAAPEGTFAAKEAVALAVTEEALRGFLETELQAIADGFGEEVLVDGLLYKLHEPGNDTYHSLNGGLRVRRASYRQAGVHNGPIVIPLELAAAIVEGATPALAYNVAHGYAQHDMRQHLEGLATAHRVPPCRATLERLANRLGSAVVEQARRVEPVVRRSEAVPEGTAAISIGLDRTSVPMMEDRPADAPPKPERPRRKPRKRKAPAPFDVNFRMAYVGTVSFVDALGEAIETRRYAVPACDDPRELVEKMTADLRNALKKHPGLPVGIVQDGAPEMWNRTREGMAQIQKEGLIETWHEGIDRYHLLERLAAALQLVEPDATERERLLGEWREQFDLKDSTISSIERYLVQRYDALDSAERAALWDHLRYIGNNKDRMRYVTLRVAGLPVGSGVTESAAKTVIGHRAKRSGQRWREAQLRGVLSLRGLHQSQRLPRFWARLSRRYAAEVIAA